MDSALCYSSVDLSSVGMERIPSAQPPPACLERSGSLSGMDFSHIYPVFKSRKSMKRCDESKETYKLPHRLIEKKRRDRINECISQLKDLLPEHLKLTTLGHLEKAVVLELTLKHVQSLSNLIEQQQQQILTLQKGGSPMSSKASDEEMFRSGFQVCAEEALRFLQGGEKRELVAHLQRVASDLSHSPAKVSKRDEKPSPPKPQATNCVPVICRAAPLQSGEQSGTDTDTDSGYGGEVDKVDSHQRGVIREDMSVSPILDRVIKQEHEEIPKKRSRLEMADDDLRFSSSDLHSVGSYSTHPPFCFPFYLIPPTPSAYLPMLEKCWYPGSMPMLYPNLSQSGLLSQDSVPQVNSPAMPSIDSSALLQALKQVPTVGADPTE